MEKQAEARKTSAEAAAEAITKRATADATAATQRAKGAEAEQMVPISVKKAEVDVENQRVDVEKRRVVPRKVTTPPLVSFRTLAVTSSGFRVSRVTKITGHLH